MLAEWCALRCARGCNLQNGSSCASCAPRRVGWMCASRSQLARMSSGPSAAARLLCFAHSIRRSRPVSWPSAAQRGARVDVTFPNGESSAHRGPRRVGGTAARAWSATGLDVELSARRFRVALPSWTDLAELARERCVAQRRVRLEELRPERADRAQDAAGVAACSTVLGKPRRSRATPRGVPSASAHSIRPRSIVATRGSRTGKA